MLSNETYRGHSLLCLLAAASTKVYDYLWVSNCWDCACSIFKKNPPEIAPYHPSAEKSFDNENYLDHLLSSMDSPNGEQYPCQLSLHPHSTLPDTLQGRVENAATTWDVIGLSHSRDFGMGCAKKHKCKWYNYLSVDKYYIRTKLGNLDKETEKWRAKSLYHSCKAQGGARDNVGTPQWQRKK